MQVTGKLGPVGEIYADPKVRLFGWSPSHVVVLRRAPPIVIQYPAFLNDAECAHLIGLVEARFTKSLIGGGGAGLGPDAARTSYSAPFEKGEDAVVRAVEERAAHIAGFPSDNIERLQVVRYVKGQQYQAHWDSYGMHNPREFEIATAEGYNRVCTFLVYLNDVVCTGQHGAECHGEINGATLFPLLSTAVAPKKGCAVFWHNTDATLRSYDAALHQGLPVCCGVKYALNIWVHGRDVWRYGEVLAKIREQERGDKRAVEASDRIVEAAIAAGK